MKSCIFYEFCNFLMLFQHLTNKAGKKPASMEVKHILPFFWAGKGRKTRNCSILLIWISKKTINGYNCKFKLVSSIWIPTEDFMHSKFPPEFSVLFVYSVIALCTGQFFFNPSKLSIFIPHYIRCKPRDTVRLCRSPACCLNRPRARGLWFTQQEQDPFL